MSYWVGSGKNRNYRVGRKFFPSQKIRTLNVTFHEEGFKATVAFYGTTRVGVSAVRISDELCRNILVLLSIDKGGKERGNGYC